MKKQLKEWGVIFGIFGVLYITGLHTEVAGFIQRIILSTGVIQADVIPEAEQQTAPYNFLLTDSNNKKVPFESLRGKTIFLNFWATWCPPCIAEMPDIHELYLTVKNNNVAFVLISQDKNFDKAKNFIERNGYSFPIYHLASNLPEVYHSRSIPTTFVISKEGKIVSKRVGMAKYNTQEFRKLLTD